MLFTRLPWWRLRQVPKEAFEHVVDYWPFVGWLTGGVMALVFCLSLFLGFSIPVAALLAIASRLLLTGALHEDGLADFCDGFGGGTTRERTLEIMKDSHIGTYGVLGLILYLGLLWASLVSLGNIRFGNLPLDDILLYGIIILFLDVTAKVAASLITGQLPYARNSEGAKNQVVYVGRSFGQWLWHAVRCTAALALPVFLLSFAGLPQLLCLLPVPFVVELCLVSWMRRRIGGYTGDCCGALFLLCELSLYLTLPLLLTFIS